MPAAVPLEGHLYTRTWTWTGCYNIIIAACLISITSQLNGRHKRVEPGSWNYANSLRCPCRHIQTALCLYSNVQKNTVGQKLRSSVIKSCPYSSVFMSYSVRSRRTRRRIEEEDKMWKMSLTFLSCWCIFAWKSGYHCLLYSAHFLLDGSIPPVSTL